MPLSARAVAFVPATADEAEEVAGEDEEAGTDDGSIASSGERGALRRAGAVDVAAEWAEVEQERARVQEERALLLAREAARVQAARAEGERAWAAMQAERRARPFTYAQAQMHGAVGLEGEDGMEAPWAALGQPSDYGAWWVEEEARAEAAWRAGGVEVGCMGPAERRAPRAWACVACVLACACAWCLWRVERVPVCGDSNPCPTSLTY